MGGKQEWKVKANPLSTWAEATFPPSTCPLLLAVRLIGPPGFTLRFGGRREVLGGNEPTGLKFKNTLTLSTCPFPRGARPPLHRDLLRIEQFSGTTSSQNILEITFSVETQKFFCVSSGLVGDWRFAQDEVES